MFAIELDQHHKVVLVRLSDRLTQHDVSVLDDIARVLVEAEGPVSAIFDLSAVSAVDVPRTVVERRGRMPQLAPGHPRVMIAPQPDVRALCEAFARLQAESGSEPPTVVDTMAQALARLGLGPLTFRPMEIGWLRDALAAHREPPN